MECDPIPEDNVHLGGGFRTPSNSGNNGQNTAVQIAWCAGSDIREKNS